MSKRLGLKEPALTAPDCPDGFLGKDTKWSRSVDPTVNYVISTARVTVWMQKVPLDLCSAGKLQLDQKLKPAPRK